MTEPEQFETTEVSTNPDPITGEPGAHPVGTSLGAAAAGRYEAQNDGRSVAWNEARYAVKDAWERARRNDFFFNEDLYWREHYQTQPYYNPNLSYQDYQPAYRVGYEGYAEYIETGASYEEMEQRLRHNYETDYGGVGLAWVQAKHAVWDGWNRAKQTFWG